MTALRAQAPTTRYLVREGKPAATIVIGSAHPERARAAADELNEHLVRATGVGLPVVEEAPDWEVPYDRTLVIIGGGTLAESLVDLEDGLKTEEYLVATSGRHVVFLGSDTTGKGDGEGATRWAVGHFLDHRMGVRWLWPGEVGTFVPKKRTITVPDMRVRHQPRLVHRHFRPTGLAEVPVLGRGALTRLQAEVNTWRDRQQMGTRRKVATVHAFGDWWEKYHEKFPEIFATLPEGMVHPCPTAQRVNLCVSNPKVEQLILEEWREAGRPDRWSVSPNDGQGYCVCRNCRALDVPDTLDADPLDIFWNRNVVTLAGRYLNLWGRLLTTMRKENPDVWLVSLAYANYRNATPGMEPLPYDDALVVTLLPDNWWAQSEY
jgi:hypothetical protein